MMRVDIDDQPVFEPGLLHCLLGAGQRVARVGRFAELIKIACWLDAGIHEDCSVRNEKYGAMRPV